MDKNQHLSAGHFDVIVVGAGISGIAAAHYLTTLCPDHTYAVLESHASFGGTWLLHQYPGVRSDSDLYTYGYAFKPWTRKPIATGDEILGYMEEVIRDDGIEPHIRYGHTIRSASWSSTTNVWTLEVTRAADGKTVRFTTNYLWTCHGYYRHAEGYTPEWPGMDAFQGQLVHPQSWPEDLDCTGKRVVVIGSGATAATLLPALAGKCATVTMLQRSPTYFNIGRNEVPLATELRKLNIDERWIHEIIRRKLLSDKYVTILRARNEPDDYRRELLANVRAHLGEGHEAIPHFDPHYRPWTQRIAFDPDGGLFASVREGQAGVVTGEIERFCENGIQLKSGVVLEADIVVTATGFHLSVMGDIAFTVDGEPVDFAQTVAYRGTALTGVPNFAWVFGYYRSSWTLRVGMVAEFVCKMLNHMRRTGASRVTPVLRQEDEGMQLRPWIDPKDFNPGYVQRRVHLLPRQGCKPEWRIGEDYQQETDEFACIDLEDPIFEYVRSDSVAEAGA
ncbi:MAG: NAD(P)/FAD-dependent oxidoreductase [Proteobacteria bacterium]|nr:NAD(P)/FAD-dependent oxidoreductase [Pseudomonadota bacterium]